MGAETTIRELILVTVRRIPDCTLEELVTELSGATWREIFIEVDRLSRLGELRLISRGAGSYSIRLQAA